MVEQEYHKTVNHIEDPLRPCAKRSFDSHHFLGGEDVFSYFSRQWARKENQLKLRYRSPIQIERDRILYSHGMRKQTEKYHVLYNGQRRIVRAYATHTMKMAQVARAICRGLRLNQDFAEAIALGAKIGAIPFLHASKGIVSEWAENKVISIDNSLSSENPVNNSKKNQLSLDFPRTEIPRFVDGLKSSVVLDKIQQFMPWAAGSKDAKLYTSGQESYWLLCTNPYTNEAQKNFYLPETMWGIWRHSRGIKPGINPFHHRCKLSNTTGGFYELKDDHATFEAIVVQYADDITWVIENLNDANDVALLNNQSKSVFAGLANDLGPEIDGSLEKAITKNDPGSIYTYFISDFVKHSEDVLQKIGQEADIRSQLPKGNKDVLIGLSSEAEEILDKMVKYLNANIFLEPRTKNRSEMLKSVTHACLELIYQSEEVLPRMVQEQARLGQWSTETFKSANDLLNDKIHRIQLSMDVLSSWSDQEIYDFVGIQSL